MSDHPILTLYFVGCVVSFAWGMVCVAMYAYSPLTVRGQNLRRVGLRTSWISGKPKEIDEDDWAYSFGGFFQKLGLSIILYAVVSLTSWLFLITLPFTFLSGIVRAMSMPKDIRDSVWRLKNMPMDFDGVFSTLKKMEGKSEFALEREQLLISMRDRKLISAREFEAMTAHGKAEIDHDG